MSRLKVRIINKKVNLFNNRVTTVEIQGGFFVESDTLDSHIRSFCEGFQYKDKYNSIAVKYDAKKHICAILATGKTVRSNEDPYNDKFVEHIAETRAKIAIYDFMFVIAESILISQFEILYGKHYKQFIKPAFNVLEDITDGVLGDYFKYKHLRTKEKEHLHKLLSL